MELTTPHTLGIQEERLTLPGNAAGDHRRTTRAPYSSYPRMVLAFPRLTGTGGTMRSRANREAAELPELLTAAQVASLLHLAPQTLAGWRCRRPDRQLPYIKIGARSVRYRRRDIERWLKARERVG